jgi:hypothetical protein
MKILCAELVNELIQPVTFEKEFTLEGIYPFLLMINSPSGTFNFEMIKDATTIFFKSFTSADLKAALGTTNDYLYSFHPIVPSSPIRVKRGNYTFKLSHLGYTFNESSFLGWGQQHENRQNSVSYTITGSSNIPLAFRIKTKIEGIND